MTLSELKALREEITPGKWDTLTDLDTRLVDVTSDNDDEVIAMNMREGDADFLILAPSILDQLIALEEWKEKVWYAMQYCDGTCKNALEALDANTYPIFVDGHGDVQEGDKKV